MYQYYNAHPKGLLVPDCVKRAISKAASMDYNQVQLELNRYKKVTGAKYFNSDRNPDRYVTDVLKAEKISFPAQKGKPRMNGERFCLAYPKGNYILQMAGHWTCCVDGVIYDTWDPSDKCVYVAWKIPNKKEYRVRIHSGSICDQDIIQEPGDVKEQLRKDFEYFLSKLNTDSKIRKFEIDIQ